MIDSKCNESGLENTGSGFPICDKQQPIAAKKTALRDLQNDNRVVVPKPLADPSFVKDIGQIADVVKVSGIKRPTPEGPTSPLHHQSPSSNGANAQFVYIRRKSEQELIKSNTSDNTNRIVDGPHLKEISHVEQETSRQQTQTTQVQGLKVSPFPAHAPMPMTSLLTFSSGPPSVPNSLGKPVNVLVAAGTNHRTVGSEILPITVNNPQGMNERNWKERFSHLQAVLRNCDQSSQEEYIEMLNSLSSVGRSRHAVELEKRAIHLLLEEGKEIQRMNILNVLGKPLMKNNNSPTSPQVQLGK